MRLRAVLSALLILLVLVADQVAKILVKTHMSLYEHIELTNWFHIAFVENRGMAFGMDFIGTSILTLFRFLAVCIFGWYLVRCIRRCLPIGFIVCLSLVIAGAMGNIIDNCLYGLIFTESQPANPFFAPVAEIAQYGRVHSQFLSGKVVDMLYFPLWEWPGSMPVLGGRTFFGAVFNLADSAISVGAVAIILFYHQLLTQPKESTTKEDKAASC